MQIYKYISDICAKREISIAKLEKDVGFALGTVRRWGAVMPSVDKMVKVADYLNVTVLAERMGMLSTDIAAE